MPRERNPNRDRAYQIWLEHNGNVTNRQIAEMLGVNEKVIAVWKQRDKWKVVQHSPDESCTTRKRGAPKGNKNAFGKSGGAPTGNKNAVGNVGGGAPLRNHNAIKTGEYETIWLDTLDEKELELYEQIDLDPMAQVNEQLRFFSIRERRMMMRIRKLTEGLTEKQRRVLQERVSIKEPVQVHDEKSGQSKTVVLTRNQLVTTEIEETEYRAIEDILSLEEALTRVQDKKLKAIQLKAQLLSNGGGQEKEITVRRWSRDKSGA
ncbi:uncharacterized protein YjcR [Brevibacillus sp. AG162]|uniref:phage terminase small subunit n=1 Tax=Brevibacillus sp. AG162 TaxID=2572910 RepID=UPI00114E5F39|nr:phage terminase small subunit [Brevibacillus sp. AG162]TQK74963.1 uncharacterized protein YjcR [Brevibacillus sp. AG162]